MEGNLARCKSLVGSLLHGLIRAVQHQRHEIAVGLHRALIVGILAHILAMIGGIGKQPVAVRLLLQLLEYGLNHLVGFVDGVVVLIHNTGFAEYFILRLQQCAVWDVRTALV